MSFGANARKIREARGWTRDDMLTYLSRYGMDMVLATLRRIENEQQEPKLSEAIAIASVLDKDVNELAAPTKPDSFIIAGGAALSRAHALLDQFQAAIDTAARQYSISDFIGSAGSEITLDRVEQQTHQKSVEHLEHIKAILDQQQHAGEYDNNGGITHTVADVQHWVSRVTVYLGEPATTD